MYSCRVTLKLAIVGILALSQLALGSPSATGASSRSGCSQIVDVFATSIGTLQQCGYHVYPLTSVTTESDGTKDYVYVVGDHRVMHPVPPNGFSFAQATDAELVRYGLPKRPTDAASLPSWERQVALAHVVAAPPFLVANGMIPDTYTTDPGWSGFVITSGYNQFNDSFVDYQEPTQAPTTCPGDEVVVWAGLGGWGTGVNGALAQAGTAPHIGGGIVDHSDWFYVNPDMKPTGAFYTQYRARAYDRVQVEVSWNPNYPDYAFTTYNLTTGAIDPNTWVTSTYDGRSSEYIVEAPLISGLRPALRNFGTWTVNAAKANGIGMGSYSSIVNVRTLYYIDYLTQTPVRSGSSFTDKWQKCD